MLQSRSSRFHLEFEPELCLDRRSGMLLIRPIKYATYLPSNRDLEKIDSRGLPDAVLNERRRRAGKLREAGMTVRKMARQCMQSTHTIFEAHKAFV